jgi:hypothetical protein
MDFLPSKDIIIIIISKSWIFYFIYLFILDEFEK